MTDKTDMDQRWAVTPNIASTESLPHEYPESVRSVARALKLLALLNTSPTMSLHELHCRSGLPKPTVHRILATLDAHGYVERREGVYRVAAKVQDLSAGYSEHSFIVDLFRPILLAATQRFKWPLALGQLDQLEMAVRYSTMRQSPLAIRSATAGRRYSLVRSGMGIAYLAFCTDQEREFLLELIQDQIKSYADRDLLERQIEETRFRGYALRSAKRTEDSATAAFPIRHNANVVATLSLTTFGSVMTETFIGRLGDTLKQVVADTETVYAERRLENKESPLLWT